MIATKTWPNYNGDEKDGVAVIMNESGLSSDVKFGRTKLFIRTPKTVFELEQKRTEIVPKLVTILQKVRRPKICVKIAFLFKSYEVGNSVVGLLQRGTIFRFCRWSHFREFKIYNGDVFRDYSVSFTPTIWAKFPKKEIGTSRFRVEIENERFSVACLRCRQNLKFGDFTTSSRRGPLTYF